MQDRDDGRIGRLLRAAGRRPGVAPDRTEAIRAAVHADWRAAVARRARRRRLVATAALAAAVAAVAVLGIVVRRTDGPVPVPKSDPAAFVERVVAPTSLHPGDTIAAGSLLTTGATERLALRLTSGHGVRLDHDTRLRVLTGRTLVLESGAVFVDSRGLSASASGSIEIETALGTVRDVGTRFEARLVQDRLRVRVGEGAVEAQGMRVGQGEELEIDAAGRAVRASWDAHGSSWRWTQEITPVMQIEGRPLGAFLAWVAREKGLKVRFESPEIARSATGIVLKGSIQDMTLDEALQSVLATSGLNGSIQGDALVVAAVQPRP